MTDNTLTNVKVGDTLILATANRYRDDEPVTVSRIGRKYLYVTRGNGYEYSARFHLADGTEDSQYGHRERLYTPERYDDIKQRAALVEALRVAGIDIRHGHRDQFTTRQLQAILNAATSDA